MYARLLATSTPAHRATRLRFVVGVGLTLVLAAASGCADDPTGTAQASPSAPTTTSPVPTPRTTAPPATAQPLTCPATSSTKGSATDPVTPADLCNATLDIPSWADSDPACPHGSVRVTAGRFPSPFDDSDHGLIDVVGADVDHDGVAEAVVTLSCHVGDPPLNQIVAFGRAATGAIRTLGQVVGPANGGINKTTGLGAYPDGSIRVGVTEARGSDPAAIAREVNQWRTYSWNGQRFAQTAGSTSFMVDKATTRLRVTATPIVLAKPQGAVRQGSLTITIVNDGTATVTALWLWPILPDGISFAAAGACAVAPSPESCAVGDIAAGATRKITINFTVKLVLVDAVVGGNNVVQLRIGDQLYTTIEGVKVVLT